MIIHFGQTGNIHRKKFADLEVDLRLQDTREGSFEFLLDYSAQASFVAGFVANAATDGLTWDLMKGAFSRVVGGDAKGAVAALEEHPDASQGDVGTLI